VHTLLHEGDCPLSSTLNPGLLDSSKTMVKQRQTRTYWTGLTTSEWNDRETVITITLQFTENCPSGN